jgi:hypothetical protein
MITSFLERWMLAKDNLRVEILRDDDTLEWVETTSDGRTTGNGGSAYAITMPTTVLDAIRAHTAEGYELVAHEQYDGEQLAAYLAENDRLQKRGDDLCDEVGALQAEILKAMAALDARNSRIASVEAERDQLRRQLEAAEAAPCDHDGPAFDALEKLHARIHRDFNFDAGECAPPTEDEPVLRMMDDLLTYATELYMPLADAAVGSGRLRIHPDTVTMLPDGRIAVTGEWHCAALGETTVTIPAEIFEAAARAWLDGQPSDRPTNGYLAHRTRQHPRTVRDFRGVAGEHPRTITDGPR